MSYLQDLSSRKYAVALEDRIIFTDDMDEEYINTATVIFGEYTVDRDEHGRFWIHGKIIPRAYTTRDDWESIRTLEDDELTTHRMEPKRLWFTLWLLRVANYKKGWHLLKEPHWIDKAKYVVPNSIPLFLEGECESD